MRLEIAGASLVAASVALMFLCLFRKKDSFIDLRNVFMSHIKLFKNCKLQYFIFYALPLFYAVGMAMLFTGTETMFTSLIVIVSILISMLLAVLSILAGKDYSSAIDENRGNLRKPAFGDCAPESSDRRGGANAAYPEESASSRRRSMAGDSGAQTPEWGFRRLPRVEGVYQVVRETINAVIFTVVLCVFLLLLCLAIVVLDDVNVRNNIANHVLSGVAYYIFTVILLNLLLIVKRISKIIEVTLYRK